MAESIFDVSRETLITATFWTKYVTSRNYCNSTMELSINFD